MNSNSESDSEMNLNFLRGKCYFNYIHQSLAEVANFIQSCHPMTILTLVLANILRTSFAPDVKISDEKIRGKYKCEIAINIEGTIYDAEGHSLIKKDSKGIWLVVKF